uniref:Phosphotransferase n=1 Tax=Ornithodoros turicata TaxID=34597 RepID=A0A2R5L9E4_9ACAR
MSWSALSEANFHYPELTLDDPSKQATVEDIVRPLVLSPHKITKIRDVFISELELGLQKNPEKASSLQMENTYLPELPDGTEKGEFLALDLGGTNFRVLHIVLDDVAEPVFHVQYFSVPEPVRLGAGEKLFDFLADCIHKFLEENKLFGKRLPLGFCFSFPMTQKALNVGILVTWTKSFNCSGVVGKDAVQLLKEAIDRRGGMDVDIVAVVNDTTGTLVKGAFLDHHCAIGMILGTGSNACYLEKVDKIAKWEGDKTWVHEVVIDVEWGAFGDNGVLNFMKTSFDKAVDENSLLVNSFTFEKLFSGKFLGELVRNVLVKLVREKVLFDGRASETLRTQRTFTTADVSHLEAEDGEGRAREIFARLGYIRVTEDDIAIVRYVCGVASSRAALLVSICLAVLLERMDKPTVTIAVDGSLYKHHPRFHRLMTDYVAVLAPDRPFKLMLAEDGSGKGAGLVAAVADRLKRAAERRASQL